MDNVLNYSEKSKKNDTSKKEILKKLYSIYHFIAEIVLSSILIILIVVGFMVSWYFVDQIRNIKNGVNTKPIFGAYVIISPSMDPTIKVQDAVVIKRKSKKDLKVGDIITFLSSDSRFSGITVTHRIVGVEKTKDGKYYYRTKGDNNNAEDSALVKYDNIYGKVILKIPKIGYIRYALTTSIGWFLLIVVPCLGIIIYDIMKMFKSIAIKGKKVDTKKGKKRGME